MTRRRTMVWIVAVTALALAASACGSDDFEKSVSPEGSTIDVRDYQFEPSSMTVEVGDTVTWVWDGRAQHNVVGDGFQSADQNSGTFEHTFDRPGTFRYECTIHPGMEGSVTVAGSSA